MDSAREKILIIEGEESFRGSLEALLSGAGYEVFTTASCQTGLQLAREKSVDLVLLDANLPGLVCGDLVAEFKGAAATAGVRIILLTSGGTAERVQGLD